MLRSTLVCFICSFLTITQAFLSTYITDKLAISSGIASNELRMTTKMLHNEKESSNWNRRLLFQSLISIPFSVVLNSNVAHSTLLDELNPQIESKVKVTKKKGEASIDPTLKGSYYYPTAKKRYLPRIQKVFDSISSVPKSIAEEDWENVSLFANKLADDAILPLKLYQSSLDGQGLSMKNSYSYKMKKDADQFESDTRNLQRAVKNKDTDSAFVALKGMSEALNDYRVAGRITNASGDIPSVQEMRQMSMRRPTISVATKKS